SETQPQHGVDDARVLVESCSESNGIGKIDVPHPRLQHRLINACACSRKPMLQCKKRRVMRRLRLQHVQRRKRQPIHNARHFPPKRRRSALLMISHSSVNPDSVCGFISGGGMGAATVCAPPGCGSTATCAAASCNFKQLANCPISCCATSWIMPDARPY